TFVVHARSHFHDCAVACKVDPNVAVIVSDSLFMTCSHSRRFIQQRLGFHHCFVVTGRVALSAFPKAEVDDT
ncbi:MAG TPA: hypothetical protein VM715_02020, partial [Candidatus Acidoferrum sp.]|nr:hypothetical protein [Candidatus Acidoferrum sp.]